jgi:hypothetical protein
MINELAALRQDWDFTLWSIGIDRLKGSELTP